MVAGYVDLVGLVADTLILCHVLDYGVALRDQDPLPCVLKIVHAVANVGKGIEPPPGDSPRACLLEDGRETGCP